MVDDLLAGHGRFRAEYAANERAFLARLARSGQRPTTLFVGCSDSRVIPELLTDAAPGQLFVIRNVANRIPVREEADTSVGAAIEYAVEQLSVSEIVVCGHDDCGGVRAALDDLLGIPADSDLARWLGGLGAPVARARVATGDSSGRLRRAVEENVLDGVANLMTFPCVARGVEADHLRLHAWVYDLHDLTLRVFDADRDGFVVTLGDGPRGTATSSP